MPNGIDNGCCIRAGTVYPGFYGYPGHRPFYGPDPRFFYGPRFAFRFPYGHPYRFSSVYGYLFRFGYGPGFYGYHHR